jgi:hypothetical protein
MRRTFILLVCWTLASVHLLSAATYWVNYGSGNDSNSGTSQGSAWKTLGHAITRNLVGDDVVILDGTGGQAFYENAIVTSSASGTAGHPITIVGTNGATLNFSCGDGSKGNWMFTGGYLVFDNLIISAHPGQAACPIALYGGHCVVKNANCHDITGYKASSGDSCWVFQIRSSYNMLSNITFNACNDCDLMQVAGDNNLLTHLMVTNCQNPNMDWSGQSCLHADLIQNGGWMNMSSVSNVLECSVMVNLGCSDGYLDPSDGYSDASDLYDHWVYRNNIFYYTSDYSGSCQALQFGTRYFHLYNNIFYNWPAHDPIFIYANYHAGEVVGSQFENNVFLKSSGIADVNGTPTFVIDYNALDSSSLNATSGDVRAFFGANNHTITEAQAGFRDAAHGDFHLTSASALIGAGANLWNDPSSSRSDKDGVQRPSSGAWDIGPYQYAAAGPVTNPVIQVSVNSLAFGAVLVGRTNTMTLTVANVGLGTLSGSATVAAPFYISSGGGYSLNSNQTQTVTVQYLPTGTNGDSRTMTFTGGGGTAVALTGSGVPLFGLSFVAIRGSMTGSMSTNGGYISDTTGGTPATAGTATYYFNLTNAGAYTLTASANAPNASANSFYVAVDAFPTDPYDIWDMPITVGFSNVPVSWRGTSTNSTYEAAQFLPKVWSNLTAGAHTLIVVGREPGAQVAGFTFVPYVTVNPPTSVTIRALAGNVILSWPVGTLQTAIDLRGPWGDVTGAISPRTNPVAAPRQFYRLRLQ